MKLKLKEVGKELQDKCYINMKLTDLRKTLQYFECFSDKHEVFELGYPIGKAKSYYHKVEDYFGLTIFTDGGVFQSGTEADIIGCELKTFDDLTIRYKSFTGFEIDDLDETL